MGSHFSKATVSKIDETSFNYDEIFLTKKAKKDIDDEKLLFDDLMLNRADLNVKGSEGTKLLHAACRRGFLDVVHFFVDLGADVNSRGNDKSTILHEAVVGNNFELIDFLLFNGLDINAKDKRGETPLHRLVVPSQKNYNNFETDKIRENKFKEYVDMVEFLVDNGADVNAQDGNFVTPLEKAVYMNFVEICECLLELKASIEFRKDVILFSFYVPNEKIKKDDTEIESLRLLTAFLATRKDDISQYIDAISKQDFGNFHWVEFLFHECKLEVEQMKKINICEERNVSHFDFLTKDLMEVTNFSRSGDLMTVLESREFKEKFSCYKYLLEKRIGRIKKLQNCINAITKFLKKYAKLNLPIVVLDKIFSFLSAGDVRNFGRALSIKRKK